MAGLHRADPQHDHARASRLAQLIALLGDQEARAPLNPDQVITRTIELRDMAGSYLKLLTALARQCAKVGTMSRRLSAIKFACQMQNLPDPTRHARVVAALEGNRRSHCAPPEQAAAPLMPPELLDVLDACPQKKTWRAGGRTTEPDHSLRAGFVTYAQHHLRGATSDRAIAHETRHRSLATLDGYVRIDHAWTDNAAATPGL